MACLNTRDNANLKRLALRLISQDSKLKETNYETTTVHGALFLGRRRKQCLTQRRAKAQLYVISNKGKISQFTNPIASAVQVQRHQPGGCL